MGISRALAPGSLATGCTVGSVSLPDGLDDFGPVRSAAWVATTYDYGGGEIETDHFLAVSSNGGFCRDLQSLYGEIDDFDLDFYDAYYDLYDKLKQKYGDDYDALYAELNRRSCETFETLYEQYADVTKRLLDRTNLISLYVQTRGPNGFDDRPSVGVYQGSEGPGCDGGGRSYTGTITYYDTNPYEEVADQLAEVDCDALGAYDYWTKKVDYDSLENESARISGGQLVLEQRGDDAFDGELTAASADDEPGFELAATFERCDVVLDGHSYFYLRY